MSAPEWYACRSCERDVYAPNDPSPREADGYCCDCSGACDSCGQPMDANQGGWCSECVAVLVAERGDEWWAGEVAS